MTLGVCDSIEQFLDDYGTDIEADERLWCVSFTEVRKADQSPSGGWRWTKWGPYVGHKEPTAEYLYNEADFERVFVFHMFQKKTKP